MIKSLRKRHVQIWTSLAVLLPAGIIAAWIAIPCYPSQPLLQPFTAQPLPEVAAQTEKEDYSVYVRSNPAHTAWQLQWINKKTLTWPTATVYQVRKGSNDINKGALLGRIEARGSYYFNLDPSFPWKDTAAYQLILYDFIHQQIIDTINL